MTKNLVLTFVLCAAFGTLFGQKRAYVPAYIRDTNTVEGKQFTWSKTAQSANFFMIWGDSSGGNPAVAADANLRFTPSAVLDTMEYIYRRCADLGMIHDGPGTLATKYKYVIVMYGTYGPDGPQGWANGWAVDDSIGAFWVHPNATRDGGVIAHEFTHSLQAMYHIDGQNPNRAGMAIFDNIGLFYETHANYVRNVIYPHFVSSDIDAHHVLMLEPDWKVNYEGYPILFHVHETWGLPMVSRLWTEWKPEEFPLQTLRRLTGLTQAAFNDSLYRYAAKSATWDYPTNGWDTYLRESRRVRLRERWGRVFAQRTYDVLHALDTASGRYYTPPHIAPQDYGYNLVRLYPTERSQEIAVSFIGHAEVNNHAGWRYGFVTVNKDGERVRYGAIHSQARQRISITLASDEEELFLVVMGAPTDSMHARRDQHTTWKGNPSRYHYPWEVFISNARPEGYQPPTLVRPWLRTAPGAPHVNGGGWVDNRSVVDASVYVAPRAIVLGTSRVSGSARIEGYAVVEDADVSENAIVTDNGFVIGGSMRGNSIVRGQCISSNNTVTGNAILGGASMVSNYRLGGSVRVDGDLVVYNETGECDTGEYHVLTQYYRNELLPCDGRDSTHPENVSVNRPMAFDVVSVRESESGKESVCSIFPTPSRAPFVHVSIPPSITAVHFTVVDVMGKIVRSGSLKGAYTSHTMDVDGIPAGHYTVLFSSEAWRSSHAASLLIQ